MNRFIKYVFIILIFINYPAYPQGVIKGGVELDWPLLSQQERTKAINYYREIIFNDVRYKIEKDQLKPYKKDPNKKQNIRAVRNEFKNLPDRELAGFYFLNKILFLYGVKYYDDKHHIYYYNMLGGLEFVDILDRPHDQYPYIAYKYKRNGKLVEAAYYISEYDQYCFDEDGDFKGRWYMDKLYDKKAKIILSRRLP